MTTRIKDVLALALAVCVVLGAYWLFGTIRSDLAFHKAIIESIQKQNAVQR